jgi:soluble lytic murein transglycosylase-like protein
MDWKEHWRHLGRYAKWWWSRPLNVLGISFCCLIGVSLAWIDGKEREWHLLMQAQVKIYRQHMEVLKRVPNSLRQHMTRLCDETGVPEYLVARLVQAESEWNEKCVGGPNDNGTYDYGLCQINGDNLRDFPKQYYRGREPFDVMNPYHNLEVAIRHLADLYRGHGNWYDTVVAYNAGSGSVWSGRVPRSTLAYAKKILPSWERRL